MNLKMMRIVQASHSCSLIGCVKSYMSDKIWVELLDDNQNRLFFFNYLCYIYNINRIFYMLLIIIYPGRQAWDE